MALSQLNDLCESCGVVDGITIVKDLFVCFKCQRKLKKANRKLKEGEQDDRYEFFHRSKQSKNVHK